MKEKEGGNETPERNPAKTFIQIIQENSPKDERKWNMGIELCAPDSSETPRWAKDYLGYDDEPENIVGVIEVHPVEQAYNIIYVPEDSTQLGWSLSLDQNGNISNPKGISSETFLMGLDMIIDHEFPIPAFRSAEIHVSEGEGVFNLPEGHGFTGTLVNRNMYVGAIAVHYQYNPPVE